MSKVTIVVLCTVTVIFSYLTYGCDAIRVYDLDVAASEKHKEWKKGEESDHHQSDFNKHNEKGEKGYDKKHRYFTFI